MHERTPSQPPPQVPPDDLVGAVVGGKYRVLQRVARGGMSRIYRAVQEPLGRPVALKVLDPMRADEAELIEFRARFLREAATVARLRHPNTVTLHDYGTIERTGAVYMVMEFVEGRNLHQVIREEGPLEPLRAVRIAWEVTRSLQEAHDQGIIHRDLKSSNVMLSPMLEGEAVKVVDFGIAKTDLDVITVNNDVLGSPRYMSPEQVSRGVMDARSDLYSLGVVLFEMLTGRPPFQGGSSLRTMMAHVQQEAPSVRDWAPRPLPDSLVAVVTTCMAKRPSDRPPSALALRQQLHNVLVELGGPDLAVDLGSTELWSLPRQAPRLGRKPRRWLFGSALLALAATAVLGCSALGAWVAYSIAGGGPSPAADAAIGAPVVTLTSTPAGAEVWEGGVRLGTTPLELPADPAQARRFELRLDGFAPVVVTRPPTATSVQVDTALTPVVPPASAPTPSPAEPTPRPASPAAASEPAPVEPAPVEPAPSPVAGPVPAPVKTPIMMER